MNADRRGSWGRIFRTFLSLNLLLAAAWLGAAPASADRAGLDTPETLYAPVGAVQLWVDVESQAARSGVVSISWRADSSWVPLAFSSTVFGVTGSTAVPPGGLELRFSPAGRFSADVAITFADANGIILEEHRLRNVPFDPARTFDGWITWNDMAAGNIPPGPSPSPTPSPGGGPDRQPSNLPGAHTNIQENHSSTSVTSPKSLGTTGAAGPLLVGILAGGVLSAVAGTVLVLRQRRLRAAQAPRSLAAGRAEQQGETR